MINLINLLNTAIISASIGANLGINNKPNRQESNRANGEIQYIDYNENLQFQNNTNQSIHFNETLTYDNIDYVKDQYARFEKYNYSKIVTPFTAYSTIYTETYANLQHTYEGYKNVNTTSDYYNDLFIYIQINPNNVNINNTLNIKVRLKIGNVFGYTGMIKNGYISGNMYVTQDNVTTYYNRTSFTSPFKTYEDQITSPQNGYRYNVYPLSNTINLNETENQTITFNQQITINPSGANYILIFLTPTIQYDGDPFINADAQTYSEAPGSNKWTWIEGIDGNYHWYNPTYLEDPINITGQYTVNPNSYEVIDIPGLMFEILTMPFTFISMAFNLTLFPGTPYQVNISSLLLTIIGLAILIMILTIIIKVKTGV